jgi:hypothetical protein
MQTYSILLVMIFHGDYFTILTLEDNIFEESAEEVLPIWSFRLGSTSAILGCYTSPTKIVNSAGQTKKDVLSTENSLRKAECTDTAESLPSK